MSDKRQRQQARRRARKAKAQATVPAYLGAALRLAHAAGPGLHHVTVRHDAECPMLNGGGACICAPVVEYGTPDGRGGADPSVSEGLSQAHLSMARDWHDHED